MSSPLIHAFFVGRAFAEALYEQAEHTFTDAMSELGKWDAEQRERLRQFTQEVMERAQREEAAAMQGGTTTAIVPLDSQPADLQATIDELRAEIAQLRAELKRYRSNAV
jgi:chromosome segregation ATPase